MALACLVALVGGLALMLLGCGGSSNDTKADTNRALLKRQEAAQNRKLQILKAELQLEKERKAIREAHAELSESPPEAEEALSHLAGFEALEESLSGQVGVAIGPPDGNSTASAGTLQTGAAWSTSKIPVVLRVLEDAGGPSGLTSEQADEIRRALTLSDNEAALALFADLERTYGGPDGAAAAVDEVLREAGDSTTHVSSEGRDGFTPFGQTEWSLVLQEQFMSRLAAGCIGSPASTEYVLGLMGEVSSDTWGLGSAGLPALWKGGWGPEADGRYLARQMGLLFVDGKEAVVVLAALPEDGQFATAESMATSLAQWLAKQAPKYAAAPPGC